MPIAIVSALLAAALGAATPSATPADEQLRQQIDAYLGSIDTPIPAARWKALGAGAPAILAAIARDARELPSRRTKAVEALGVVGGGEAAQVARELSGKDASFALRAAAVEALGRLLPPSELEAALAPVLKGAAQARVRAVAAETLARHGPKDACATVRAQVDAEAPNDRARYHRALTACEKR